MSASKGDGTATVCTTLSTTVYTTPDVQDSDSGGKTDVRTPSLKTPDIASENDVATERVSGVEAFWDWVTDTSTPAVYLHIVAVVLM